MRELNIQFQEKYKQCDKFIKDCFNTDSGVSEYLNQMEKETRNAFGVIAGWQTDYKELKHLRWVRNQLAHDASIDSEICTEEDFAWLCGFYNRLMKAEDPMALLYKYRDSIKKQSKPSPAVRQEQTSGVNPRGNTLATDSKSGKKTNNKSGNESDNQTDNKKELNVLKVTAILVIIGIVVILAMLAYLLFYM